MKRCVACTRTYDGADWTCPACGHAPEVHAGFPCLAPHLLKAGDAFDARSFDGLAKLEEGSFWFGPRNRLIGWAFSRYFPDAKTFFEIGCGTGIVLKQLAAERPNLSVHGADIFVEGLPHAAERVGQRASFIQVDALNLPFDREFDAVGAFDVIEHIDDDARALKELWRTVKPGGGAMIIVPRHKFLWSRVDELAQHKRRYSGRELAARMREAGFEIVRQLIFGMLTLPLQVISRRLLPQKGERLVDLLELNQPAWQTALLKALLWLDQIPIRMGVNYPCGASLLVIARRPH